MLRAGDTATVIDGLDNGKTVTVLEVYEFTALCSTDGVAFEELYGFSGDYEFNLERLQLKKASLKEGDVVVVLKETEEGKKNINKKAKAGMIGKIVNLSKFKATVSFGGNKVVIGLKLLQRKSFDKPKIKVVKFKHGDVVIYKNKDKRSIGYVEDKSSRACIIRNLSGKTISCENKRIIKRVTIPEMLKKATTIKSDENKEDIKNRLVELYSDEFSLKKIKNKEVRKASRQKISELIKYTLRDFNSNKKSGIMFPNGGTISDDLTSSDKIRNIKIKFFSYLRWKQENKPAELSTKTVTTHYDFQLKKQGSVNAESGQFLKLKELINKGVIDCEKVPGKLKNNYLGIEIECYVVPNLERLRALSARKLSETDENGERIRYTRDIRPERIFRFVTPDEIDSNEPLGGDAVALIKDDIKEQYIEAGLSRYVSITKDNSLRPPTGTAPIEVRVLVKQCDVGKILPKIMSIIIANGGSINHACGVHVHVDMRHRNPEECYSRLYNAQQHLFNSIPEARRGNEYCWPNVKSTLSKQSQHARSNYSGRHQRYAAINTLAYDRHKTIEVRLHEGSVDTERLLHWIRTILSIINSEQLTTYNEEFEVFLSKLNNYSDEDKVLLRQRIEQFAS